MFQKSTEQALFAILICLEFSQVRIHHHKYILERYKFILHLYISFGLWLRGGTVGVIVIEVSK